MPPLIILAIITGLPLLLAILLRVKPLYLFVSLVTGYFWAEFLGDSAGLLVGTFTNVSNTDVITNVFLLLIPVLLTFILMRKTLSAASLPFQFILLVADSLLLATFLLPLLTPGLQGSIYLTDAGNIMRKSQDIIIVTVAGMHLLVMFLMRPKSHGKHGKRHK